MPAAGIKARFEGTCDTCGGTIHEGDLMDRVDRNSNKWSHAECLKGGNRGGGNGGRRDAYEPRDNRRHDDPPPPRSNGGGGPNSYAIREELATCAQALRTAYMSLDRLVTMLEERERR